MENVFGENTKKLGFGMMRLPELATSGKFGNIDIELTKKMVDYFISEGFTYFDTAWMYCGFKSEDAAGEALVSRHNRNEFTLATKLHSGFFNSEEEREKVFKTQLEKTRVDYFDYYLLHDLGEDHYKKYQKFGCFEWLADKKKAGYVRHMGFSYHDRADLLDRILTEHPEVIVDVDNAVAVDVGTDRAARLGVASQHLGDEPGHVVDVHVVVMVHVTGLIAVAVLEQGYHLDIAPGALGTVVKQGFHLVDEGAAGLQVVHGVELVGDAADQAIGGVALLGGVQLHCGEVAGIDIDGTDGGVTVACYNPDLVVDITVKYNHHVIKFAGRIDGDRFLAGPYLEGRLAVGTVVIGLSVQHHGHLVVTVQVIGRADEGTAVSGNQIAAVGKHVGSA